MTYPGGKNGEGVYQQIINLMPPHGHYVEPFLGSGAVFRSKRPAPGHNVGIDSDVEAIVNFTNQFPDLRGTFHVADALEYLRRDPIAQNRSTLIYCDPPYLRTTRSSKRRMYTHEMWDPESHRELLRILKRARAMVILSGYWSELYGRQLESWEHHSFDTTTHRGKVVTEHLWFNFPRPIALHDYRYLGADFRERERIKRKTARWIARLKAMPELEKHAMMHALETAWGLSDRARK